MSEKRQSWTFRTSRRFWQRDDLSLGAKGIAHILLSYADKEGIAFPTTPQLAAAAQTSHNTVDKYLDELRSKNVISWTLWKDQFGHKRRRFYLDAQHPKFEVCQHPKFGALTCTSKHAQRLFIAPSSWDGLGGNKHDGRRTLANTPP